ncbi:MAG: ComEA family DNA-binding protein [Methylococcales bacterium]|jgi:competence protein ComEA|nr:ComEA family DNA-binding protein [Methylococcales bacterium]MBT3507339.1 ComEA family DNA-binding protein [Methylococcales bacterium]MBT3699354.1 ComEA family DNA-binding protein [Methylococcales bacterium]MBT3816437.1 ComEA family DNA-binding protein [Methylococcales bacterium]MBT4032008.1 ComEA family DNA-binding protein [Methylococcales bacterium]
MFKYFIFLLFVSLTVTAAPININTANSTEIANALNGIGLKKAEAIINYREKNGSFSSLDQLNRVKGIGKKTLKNNQQDIQFAAP